MIIYNRNLHKRVSRISRWLMCIILIGFFMISLLPFTSAAGTDATFDSVSAKAIPPVQGVGGELIIEANAEFFGGCCYHLYARDVKAELIVPENVRIVGPEPGTISEVDAVPGGTSTTQKFKWTVIGDIPGDYDLEVKVSTSNCGSQTGKIQVSIVKGVSVSNVKIHPKIPSVKEEISFLVDIRSGNELVSINQTTLYIWQSREDYPNPETSLKADENLVYKVVGENKVIKSDTNNTNMTNETNEDDINSNLKLIGEGNSYDMNSVQFSDTWRTRLDEFDNEENIYYWFSVETSDGEIVTSAVYKQKIENLEEKYRMVDISIWTTAFVVALGVIIILGISWSYFGRVNKKLDKSGIFVLGSTTYTKPSEGKRANITGLSFRQYKSLIFLIFFIIAIILIGLSFHYGLFDSLITEVGG